MRRLVTWISTTLIYLPLWFTRRAWPMLMLLGVGMTAGIILTCTVPLLTYTSLTASVQHALAQPYSNNIVISDNITRFSSTELEDATPKITNTIHTTLSSYISQQPDIALRSQDFPFSLLGHDQSPGKIHFKAFSPLYLTHQFPLISGRFPNSNTQTHEIILSQQTAAALSAQVGDILSIPLDDNQIQTSRLSPILFHVVGIVTSTTGDINDPFNTEPIDPIQSSGQNSYTALMLNTDFPQVFAILNNVAVPASEQGVQVIWVYDIITKQVTERDLQTIQDHLLALPFSIDQRFSLYQGMNDAVYGNALPIIQSYNKRIQNTQLPLTAILIQMLLLVFGFVITIAELIIENQITAIALLRSRGASVTQLIVAIMAPSIVISTISVILGPPLAIAVTAFIAYISGNWTDTSPAISSMIAHFFQEIAELKWYTISIVCVLLLMLFFTLFRALKMNILTVRREAARSFAQPFWQKFYLDVFAAFISFCFYLSYVFFINTIANPDTYVSLAPFSIYAPIFLLISSVILFARVLPWIVERCIPLAMRYRGIVPLLISTQLIQSRQKMMRVTLFFALAIVVGSFVIIYHASLEQHNNDYATFQVGADFSGSLPITTTNAITYQQQQMLFQQIPGVQGASLGAVIDIHPSTTTGQPVLPPLRLLSADSNTFSQVGAWPSQTGPNLLHLMKQLTDQRISALSHNIIPAIVDDAMWQELHFRPGMQFVLDLSGMGALTLHFQAVQQTGHIPMVDDITGYMSSNITGGFFVDFSTLTAVIHNLYPRQSTPAGYVWLKTTHNTAGIAQIRKILHQSPYQMVGFQDRYKILDDIRLDPLELAVQGITVIGAGIAVMLAIIMILLVFWSTFQKRLLNLTTIYAMGARRSEVITILFLEDGVLILLGIIIGFFLGLQLAGIIVPLMTFAQSSDTQQSIINLLIPPPKLVVPWQPILSGIGGMLLSYLIIMYFSIRRRIQSKAVMTLRLNED